MMKWSRDHGLTCGFYSENGNYQHRRYMTFRKVSRFDQTFKVTKVQELFSGFDLCDVEKSVKMRNVI